MNIDLKKISIDRLKHLSTKSISEMKHLGIRTVADALLFFPSDKGFKEIQTYIPGHHFSHPQKIKFKDGADISAIVYRTSKVIPKSCKNGALRVSFHCVPAEDKTTRTTDKQLYHDKRGFWLNDFINDKSRQKKILHAFANNRFFTVEGPYDKKWNNITVSGADDFHDASGSVKISHGTLVTSIGKYTQKTGVPEKDIQKIMLTVVSECSVYARELVPFSVRQKHHLMSRSDAIFYCHIDIDNKKQYHRAIKSEQFEELYDYALKLAKLHRNRSRQPGFNIPIDRSVLKRFTDSLPFKLTRDQHDSVGDILYDLHRPYKMMRLLQGDVGSGKTVVAAYAVLATIEAGCQAAVMIPTTVLGEQHYKTFTKMFKGLNIRIALLTGKTTRHDKRAILKKVKAGQVDLLIGTEALYQRGTTYKKLGLAVIDEQHRFGVRQRKALEKKTNGCNVLSMTATPIPRTLATAMYHAMDVSQIRTMPSGRKPIKTTWVSARKATDSYLRNEIINCVDHSNIHGQTFIITKLVRPSSNPMMKGVLNANDVYKGIKKLLEDTGINVGLVTGKMKDDEKNAILSKFAQNQIQVLVATSVVEVGVDIPHANNIIILNADRYGLAQLHQLRGRVGRNSSQAYCLLVSDPTTDTGVKRMKAMESTSDGFKLAHIDLKIRGGGNIFGRAQSGLPDFPLADLGDDADVQLLQIAQQDAERQLR